MSNTAVQVDSTYLCFNLKTEILTDNCRGRLEHLGVECLEEAGAKRAFGIIPYPIEILTLIARDPDINSVSVEAPPSGF